MADGVIETAQAEPISLTTVEPTRPMTLMTPLWYLLGGREAIRSIAATPGALWLGLAFVFTAGLAREYDGEYLPAEPWHLLIPLGASLGTSFLLYNLLWVVTIRWGRSWVPYWKTYRMFLSLYWMTAPLAWLYAIPVERLLTEVGATKANLNLLLIVSVWRVLLITRASCVLLREHWGRVLFPVLLFADSVALFLTQYVDVPLIAIMGGVRLSESESLIAGATFEAQILGMLSFPIWALFTLLILIPQKFGPERQFPIKDHPLPRRLWGFPIAAAAIIAMSLPWTQSEQRLRYLAEQQLKAGRIEEAIRLMSEHARDDFPPHWDPPPRQTYWLDPYMKLLEVMPLTEDPQTAAWVKETYMEKYTRDRDSHWHQMSAAEFERVLTSMKKFEAGKSGLLKDRDKIRGSIDGLTDRWEKPPEDQIQRLRDLLDSAQPNELSP